MPLSPEVDLSEFADQDLRDIFEWSDRQFGWAQAERYVDALIVRMEQAAEQPMLGRPYPDLPGGVRRITQGNHIFYYRGIDTGIRVLRVLHQRMQQDLRLN